jgi:2-phospho-L-lactate guanylyltransferase
MSSSEGASAPGTRARSLDEASATGALVAWALVPAKSFARAKSRLAAALGEGERASLARRMLEHVLSTLAACPAVAGVMVVTDGDDVAEVASARGAVVVRDADRPPLGGIVDAALRELAARGATAALVVMSDLPDLTVVDLGALVAAFADADVVAAPDREDLGTNALAMRPPDLMRTSFGTRDSFERHLRAAEGAGLRVAVCRSPGLAFDVDEPADLAEL